MKLNRTSRAAGGCVFVHDPDIPAAYAPAFWLPEHSPGTLILARAPPGFDPDAAGFDPAALGQILAERNDANGREIVIRDASGDVHISLLDEDAIRRPAVIVPPDDAYDLRLDLASRFIRRLLGQRIGLLPPRLRLTDTQKLHYIQLLWAADLHAEGGEPRDVATEVLRSQQAALPAIEFKDSAARKRAERLIKQSIEMVNNGYLTLLRGG